MHLAARGATRPCTARRRPPRALYISSPIGLGHAQRDVAIARELRELVPGAADRLAGPEPGHARPRGRGRAHPPGQRAPGQRVQPHGVRVAPSTTCTASRPCRRMDEILVANFMVFHDVVRRGALRPVDRRRGLGARLLPAREPEREARAVRLDDRLRRLAADARRRADEAYLTADYNAEMVEHIGRASPTARPGDLRRQPRRHRPRAARPRPADDPRLDRAQLRVLRLHHRLRPRGARGPRSAAGRARLPAPTRRCASSPSAARASASDLLRRVIAAYPGGQASACPTCG